MSGEGTDLAEGEVLDFFTSLSNWGRWGDDDRLGTLNLITDEVRAAAAASIRTGRAVSLSRDIDPRAPDPLASGNSVVQRFTGTNEVEEHFGRPLRFDAVTEFVGIAAHGSNTHVDGLAHYSWDGRNYNGFPASETTSLGGARRLSVHHAAHGFLTRGVLLDIAALHGVDWLERGQPVTPDDLTAAERRQGVTVRPGDALLVHTGNVARILHEGPDAVGPAARQAGLHASCLPFLRERDVAVLGNDGVQDVQPSGYGPDLTRPVHTVGLVALGLWLIDNMELTELAAVCRGEHRWEFFFAALPWRMVGVTSSAGNPVAIF
ncbi:cyclase family protein [Saccharothrix coeruleofusca]|uniref:Cyclase n=1 Tax=Saccharothrix coeruleofusca TaxID=33919 RepID=A0A918ARQ5_9PSEU|nr:cyclase family protein [Saccharothrix coeruleofusca]MBP2334845.1 kynurenine formamidase [Saccharothrix coeruleofusca]GGP73793.1 cyclase [Saccharothrix coeruleofusca]